MQLKRSMGFLAGIVSLAGLAGCLPSKNAPNSPPRISVDGLHTSVLENEVYRDTLRRVDGKSGKLELKLSLGPNGAVVADSIVTWLASPSGDFKFVASAIDNETGLQFVYTWMVHVERRNIPPGIRDSVSGMPDFIIVGERYEDTLRVFDANMDLPILRDPADFPWLSFRDSIFIIQPKAADTGTHRVSIIAEDGKGGSDTLSWTLRISKDDAEICGFRNVKVGTSWVYHGESPLTQVYIYRNYYDSLRIQSESKRGDTTEYAVRRAMWSYEPDPFHDNLFKDLSFRLTIAGEAVRTWDSTGANAYSEQTFALDCGKEYEVAKAVILGDSTLVLKRILSRDSLGLPADWEIRVLGIGMVYSHVAAKRDKNFPEATTSLVRFNARNVRILSLDPLDMVYD